MLKYAMMTVGVLLMVVNTASAASPAQSTKERVSIAGMEDRYEAILQELAGHLSLKGGHLAVDLEKRTIQAVRGDGVKLGVLLKDGAAHVECVAPATRNSKSLTPMNKHRQNGWRTKTAKAVPSARLKACQDALVSTVRRVAGIN